VREPSVDRTDEGDVVLRNLPAVFAYALRQLPLLLSDDAPGVRCRIEQSPYGEDEEGTEDWVRHATPELEHLFVSARKLVLSDLSRLEPEDGLQLAFRISIPGAHVNAWLSALGAARIGLGDAHGLTADDMDGPPSAEFRTERDRAVLLIHVLGWAQALLIHADRPDDENP